MNELALDAVFSTETSIAFVPASGEESITPSQITEYAHSRIVAHISSELREPLRDLCRRFRCAAKGASGSILLLTGSQRQNGCSTTALALAVAGACECKPIVIDGDAVTRGLSTALVPQVSAGWDDVVRGPVRLRGAIHEFSHWPDVAVLPMRLSTPDLATLTTRPKLPEMLADIRRDFGLIVIDGGTSETTGHEWAPWADATLLVSDAGRGADAGWAASWDCLDAKGARVVGVIETNA